MTNSVVKKGSRCQAPRSSEGSEEPAMAIDSSGNPHVVWYDNTPGNYEIYYKKSTDGGAMWTGAENLSGTSYESYDPDLAPDPSGHIHVVWWSNVPGNFEIYYKKSK